MCRESAGGESFPEVLAEAIRDCRAFVALIAPGWGVDLDDPSDWVRRELLEALAARRPIVPVLLHGAAPPSRAELPPELAELADQHAVVVSESDFRDDVGRLIEVLERLGVEHVPRAIMLDVPRTGRTEARDGWDAADSPVHVRERLLGALQGRRVRTSEKDGRLLLEGGSKLKARLSGSGLAAESALPFKGRLVIRDRMASVSIEVLLVEDWGIGFFTGLRGRYESYFDKLIAELRRATVRT